MFEAIRGRLVGAWKDLHSRGLPSLFVFELIVVTLGVLLAQGLADWMGERAAEREMEEARLKVRADLGEAVQTMRWWEDLSPCFQGQMEAILMAASEGAPLDPDRLKRPAIRTTVVVPVDAATLRRIERVYGEVEAYEIQYGVRQALRIVERIEAIGDAWQDFARMDPRYGAPSPGDRDAARASAAEILSLLRGIEINARYLALGTSRIAIEPIDPEGGRPAASCDELWSTGTSYLNPEEDPATEEIE